MERCVRRFLLAEVTRLRSLSPRPAATPDQVLLRFFTRPCAGLTKPATRLLVSCSPTGPRPASRQSVADSWSCVQQVDPRRLEHPCIRARSDTTDTFLTVHPPLPKPPPRAPGRGRRAALQRPDPRRDVGPPCEPSGSRRPDACTTPDPARLPVDPTSLRRGRDCRGKMPRPPFAASRRGPVTSSSEPASSGPHPASLLAASSRTTQRSQIGSGPRPCPRPGCRRDACQELHPLLPVESLGQGHVRGTLRSETSVEVCT